jgi:hypothetical protein
VRHSMVGSNRGPASVNRTRPLLRDCGINTKIAAKALQSAADTLSDLENVNPLTMPPGMRRKLSQERARS